MIAKRKEDIGIMKFEQLDYSKYSERMDGYSHDHLDAAVGEFESEKKRKTEETVWLDMLHRVSWTVSSEEIFQDEFCICNLWFVITLEIKPVVYHADH